MRYIFSVIFVVFTFSSASAMYTTAYSPKALGISHSEFNNSMYMQAGYSKNKQTSEFDESLIDQLIASFSVNRKEYNFDESLIDQIIANFPDTLDSYMSKTPFNEITLFEILMGTYNS